MDAEFADFDNSGRMSLFVSNMYFPPFATTHNLLWKNMGGARFVNVADEQGVARCGWAWTGKFADFDNSGDLDLFVVNGKARGAGVRTEDEAVRSFAFVRNTITATPPQLREQMSLVPDFSKILPLRVRAQLPLLAKGRPLLRCRPRGGDRRPRRGAVRGARRLRQRRED